MADLVDRVWTGTARVRAAADGSGERIIEGTVVPFGVIATVRDRPGGPIYRETMLPSIADSIDPRNVRLDYMPGDPDPGYNNHRGAIKVGRGVAARATPTGLDMTFRVSGTRDGDDALALARDEVLGDLSVYFEPVAHEVQRDAGGELVARSAINLRRVTLVEQGAYQGASVTAVRAAQGGSDMTTQAAGATTSPATTGDDGEDDGQDDATTSSGGRRPNRTRVTVDVERAIAVGIEAGLAAARQAQDGQANDRTARAGAERAAARAVGAGSTGAVVTRPELLYGPGSGRSYFGDLWRQAQGRADSETLDRLGRHAAFLGDVDRAIQRAIGWDENAVGALGRAGDVLSSEIPGAYPNDYVPGLIVNRILKMRPMGGFYQRLPIDDGRPRVYPLVTTSTTVAAQGAEGSNPAASDFATTATTVTPTFYGGETKVSRQVLDGADPNTDAMLSSDLNEAYMQASEAIVRAAVEAGSTASGVALTAATPDVGLRGMVTNHLANVFLPAERLFLPTTLANSWAIQNDGNGRPLAPAYNAMNASGVFDPREFPTIGQVLYVPVVQSWSSTAGAGAGVGGVAVIGRSTDFAILESNLAAFTFDQGAEAPAAVRIGVWAYLVVGTRRGSRKATGA